MKGRPVWRVLPPHGPSARAAPVALADPHKLEQRGELYRGQGKTHGATKVAGAWFFQRPTAAVCHAGDEAVAALDQFACSEHLQAASITAVGAFERAVVGWFDPSTRQYRRNPVNEQCELLSLIGDVAEGRDGPIVHMHVTLGLADGTARGGHFLEGCSSRPWRPWSPRLPRI